MEGGGDYRYKHWKCSQVESFGGAEQMGQVNEQMYLGDIISADGSQNKNVHQEEIKALESLTTSCRFFFLHFFSIQRLG
jgi:hypothetical protein